MFLVHYFVIGALILLQAFTQPFKNVASTVLDTFFMLNYWIVVELYLLSEMLDFHWFSEAYTILLTLALLVLCLIVASHVCCLIKPNLVTTLKGKFNRRRNGYVRIQHEDSDADQQLFQAAEE